MGCAITGGAFYNPTKSNFPAAYVEQFFFADYCGNWIYYLDPANPRPATLFRSGLNQPVDMAVGPDGALYYVQRGEGHVGRIRFTGQTSQGI